MKIRTAEQYRARFERRGSHNTQKRLRTFWKERVHRLDQMFCMVDYGSYKQKPKHELRFHNINDCFPRVKKAT